MAAPLLVAKNDKTTLALLPSLANRHGLITGATGTGKSVTLQTLAQRFSSIGVPVFMADVKGDLSGLAKAGGSSSASATPAVPSATSPHAHSTPAAGSTSTAAGTTR